MNIGQIAIPDFAGSLMRGEQVQQGRELSRLQMLAQQQALADAEQFRTAAAGILPQLGTAEGAARQNLLAKLAGAGAQGAQLALPMLQQERERAEGQRLIASIFPGMGAPPAATPAPPATPAVAPGAGPVRGEAPPAVTAGINARRGLDPNSPTYAQDIMRINDGVVAATMPGGRPAAPAAPSAPAGATAAPGGAQAGLPSPQQLMMLMASGNPAAMRFAASVAPLVARDNPNYSITEVGGRRIMVNTRDPNAPRIDLGPSEAPDRTLVEIRQPDGSIRMVPRSEAANQISAAPPTDTFGRSNTLRDEFTRLTTDFRTVQSAWENMQANARSGNGQGDMAMLYQFIKLLDPTSVVRESEFAMAAQTGAIDERVAGWVQRIMTGERLPDSVRNSFLAEARSLYANQRRTYDQLSETYTDLARRNNLDPANVVVPFALRGPPQQPPGPPRSLTQAEQTQMLRDAREAISRGADPNAVRERLRERGVDPGALR